MQRADRPWLVWALALLCLAPRLPGLQAPMLEDGHAWRQAVTQMMARNFYRHGHRLLWPELDLVHWTDHGLDARRGYTDPEFPLFPWLTSLAYRLCGPHDWVARLLAALCGVATAVGLYFLGRELWGPWAGLVAGGWWALNPLAIFYTRTPLPEPLLTAVTVAALLALVRWVRGAPRAWWVALAALTLAPLLKTTSLHLLLPALVASALVYGRGAWRQPRAWLLLIVPPLANMSWFAWAHHLGALGFAHFASGLGRAQQSGLINWKLWRHNAADFYPRFTITMVFLVGGLTGWLGVLAAVRRPRDRAEWLAWAWFAAAASQTVLIAGATISHYYYNLALVVPLALLVGAGAQQPLPLRRWLVTALVLVGPAVVLQLPTVTSWYRVRPSEVAAAAAVQRVTRRDDFVFVLGYGPQLLYAADRRGDYMLADPTTLNPEALRQAARAGFAAFATGRLELLRKPSGAALAAEVARWPVAASGPDFVVLDLRRGVQTF